MINIGDKNQIGIEPGERVTSCPSRTGGCDQVDTRGNSKFLHSLLLILCLELQYEVFSYFPHRYGHRISVLPMHLTQAHNCLSGVRCCRDRGGKWSGGRGEQFNQQVLGTLSKYFFTGLFGNFSQMVDTPPPFWEPLIFLKLRASLSFIPLHVYDLGIVTQLFLFFYICV